MKEPTMVDYTEWKWPVSVVRPRSCNDENMCHWHITTPRGFATALTCRQTGREFTRVEFISDGMLYCREWNREWQKKTIARLVREMIESIPAA